jgi:hypothetical protein
MVFAAPGPSETPLRNARAEALSARLLAARSAEVLNRLTDALKGIERHLIEARLASGGGSLLADIQALDLMIQQMGGLALILESASPLLPAEPLSGLDAVLGLPRLGQLQAALKGAAQEARPTEIELF